MDAVDQVAELLAEPAQDARLGEINLVDRDSQIVGDVRGGALVTDDLEERRPVGVRERAANQPQRLAVEQLLLLVQRRRVVVGRGLRRDLLLPAQRFAAADAASTATPMDLTTR